MREGKGSYLRREVRCPALSEERRPERSAGSALSASEVDVLAHLVTHETRRPSSQQPLARAEHRRRHSTTHIHPAATATTKTRTASADVAAVHGAEIGCGGQSRHTAGSCSQEYSLPGFSLRFRTMYSTHSALLDSADSLLVLSRCS